VAGIWRRAVQPEDDGGGGDHEEEEELGGVLGSSLLGDQGERRSSGSGREREHAVAGVGVGCGVMREEVSGCGSGSWLSLAP